MVNCIKIFQAFSVTTSPESLFLRLKAQQVQRCVPPLNHVCIFKIEFETRFLTLRSSQTHSAFCFLWCGHLGACLKKKTHSFRTRKVVHRAFCVFSSVVLPVVRGHNSWVECFILTLSCSCKLHNEKGDDVQNLVQLKRREEWMGRGVCL